LPQGTDNQVFCYDEQDRMTWAGSTGTPPCTGTAISAGTLTAAQYTDWRSYDAMGRLTARPNSFASYGQDTYVYGDPAHLHAATAINGRYLNTAMTAYSAIYDAAGNMTCRDTGGGKSGAGKCVGASNGAQLTYDAEGSLVVWKDAPTNPTTTIGFLYDGHGNRVEQQATQNGTTTTTTYVGNLEEVSTTGATTTTTTYYYAGSARIATSVNGVLSYLGSDGLGSTNVALDASGNATASTLYMPYGWQRYSSGSMPTSYGFTGERSDNATQLDYFNARYYDPVAGQFTTGDTVLPGGGYEILGLSRYAYVDGNPENRTDPSGHLVNPIGPLPDPIPFLRVLPGLLEEGPTVAGAGAAATAEGACVIAEPCGATEVVVLLVIGAGVVVLSVAASSGSQQRIRDQVRSTFKADPASATAKRREALQTLHGNIDNNWVETLQQANEVNPHLGRVRAGGKLPPGPTGRVAIFGLLLVFGGAAGLWVLGEDPVDHNIYRTKDDNPSPSPSPSSPSQPSSKQKLQ
ncbi:MAG TPA: RHS repeat-associated core domain-containing protein, partial [Candidatus Dormibacteraeota bacterium]|nr:RHS repeat-associated core domain-containing protein [Candidatus Dormibacteraeota bacterium]